MMSINCLVLKGEEFKDLPNFEGFIAVSNYGRIYSYPRTVKKFCGLLKKEVIQTAAMCIRFLYEMEVLL
mgnify:CR=1 FL=1